ncbi:MAG: A24 family peptidase [Alphaproteobacteria bacterium]|nr:A24 family peptidase [Alphaproteobacteria bacterium]
MNYYTILYYGFFGVLLAGALWCMYQISAADWRRRIIPDAFLFPLLIAGLIITTFFPWPHNTQAAAMGAAFGYALAALVGFAFDYVMRKKNPDVVAPIGMGDIKLIATGGIWLGPTGLAWALVAACVLGGGWGYCKKQKYIPFAPFFVIGGILSFLGIAFLL